jgi:hypothetical protein
MKESNGGKQGGPWTTQAALPRRGVLCTECSPLLLDGPVSALDSIDWVQYMILSESGLASVAVFITPSQSVVCVQSCHTRSALTGISIGPSATSARVTMTKSNMCLRKQPQSKSGSRIQVGSLGW